MKNVNHISARTSTMVKRTAPRLVIYSKDIQLITGKSHRSSQIMLQNIRTALNKARHQFVTFREFCQFTNMDEEAVYEFLASKCR